MIRNGIYLATTRFLDGVEAYNRHVMVLRDGTMRGGGGFYYAVGSYTCSGGKWKGEMTSREHSPIAGTYPWARKDLSIGFTGTYSDDGAEFEATRTSWQAILSIQINLPAAVRGLKDDLQRVRNETGLRSLWNVDLLVRRSCNVRGSETRTENEPTCCGRVAWINWQSLVSS
jgi:hypothetical protein